MAGGLGVEIREGGLVEGFEEAIDEVRDSRVENRSQARGLSRQLPIQKWTRFIAEVYPYSDDTRSEP